MAYNVKFLKGTAAEYAATTIDDNTFYYIDGKDLYLGSIKLSNTADITAAITRIAANETAIGTLADLTTTKKTDLVNAINELKSEISALTGGESGGISDMIEDVTGALDDLDTTDKTSIVDAINEIVADLAKKDITIDTTSTTSGMLKSYTVKQGTTTIGVIDVPKDMVVQSGAVEEDPEGQPAGTYIVLTLANATNDKIYVNVGTLVDIYTAEADAAQVQLTINSSTREVSAVIVAGSITSTELADDAVVTSKIKDGAITADKLSSEVTDGLDKADSAVQTITEGATNGTIAVDGTDVAVHGLGSAAYAETTDFDAAGSAATAETNAKNYVDAALTWGSLESTKSLPPAGGPSDPVHTAQGGTEAGGIG